MSAVSKVETPTGMMPMDAAAKPFITHCNDLSMDLFVPDSPDLYHRVH